jgi:superfamily II DNA or RNA helicase
MVSEGVDIPRLRVGVYATTTTTELFFRQAVGRLVRWTRGVPRQRAWLFIPDEPRLRLLASRIGEQRRHSLRRRADEEALDRPLDAEEELADEAGDEQLSLFAVISAVATEPAEPGEDEPWPEHDAADDDPSADGVEVALAPPPPLAAGTTVLADGTPRTRREEKQHLRDANATAARELARLTGLTHAQVNAELNRQVGLKRIADATVDQLERRRRAAERWLTTG